MSHVGISEKSYSSSVQCFVSCYCLHLLMVGRKHEVMGNSF